MELAKHVPVTAIARLVGENDSRLWRIIHYYVNEARKLEDYSEVANIGIDETSRKGHNYITVIRQSISLLKILKLTKVILVT